MVAVAVVVDPVSVQILITGQQVVRINRCEVNAARAQALLVATVQHAADPAVLLALVTEFPPMSRVEIFTDPRGIEAVCEVVANATDVDRAFGAGVANGGGAGRSPTTRDSRTERSSRS